MATVELAALADARPIPDASEAFAWQMDGLDPQFLIKLRSSKLKAGHYVLRIELKSDISYLKNPAIYFDEGQGFTPETEIRLSFHRFGNMYEAWFSLPRPVRALRFDPSMAPGDFRYERMIVRRMPISLLRLGQALRYARERGGNRQRAKNALRTALMVARRGGPREVKELIRRRSDLRYHTPRGDTVDDYRHWVGKFDTLTDADLALMRDDAKQWEEKPLISIVMPTFETNGAFLHSCIQSVQNQVYENWELCIADDASESPEVVRIIREYADADPRIKFTVRERNGHICAASNSALELSTGDWVTFLDHDDIMRPHALYEFVRAIKADPTLRFVYSDEDKIDANGRRHSPHFKPDWNPALMLSCNVTTHLSFYEGERARQLRLREGMEGSQDHDFALRYSSQIGADQIGHIPLILYHWRVHEDSTAGNEEAKPYTKEAGVRAVQDYLDGREQDGKVTTAEYGYRVEYDVPSDSGKVTIIVPTKDRLDLTKTCVDSVLERTDYEDFEIVIVDNRSEKPETLAWFENIEKHDRVRVLSFDEPFNYSRINNFAVRQTDGEYVLLLNNDTEVISPDWLTIMLGEIRQPKVAAVGAKLLFADDTVQHGGVGIGLGGIAGHFFHGLEGDAPGYMARALMVQDLSAVTAACLLTTRAAYDAVGGLDEEGLTVAFNDVDYCLKLRDHGYRVVWTPYAKLYHYESQSRGLDLSPEKMERFIGEQRTMRARWGEVLHRDPFYNPNLALFDGMFRLAVPPRTSISVRSKQKGN